MVGSHYVPSFVNAEKEFQVIVSCHRPQKKSTLVPMLLLLLSGKSIFPTKKNCSTEDLVFLLVLGSGTSVSGGPI